MGFSGDIWLFVFSIVIYLILIVISIIRMRPTGTVLSYRTMMIIALIWTSFTFLELITQSRDLMIFSTQGQFLAISLLPVAMFSFVCSYIQRKISARNLTLLLLVPAATNLFVWAIPLPNLFLQELITLPGRPSLIYDFGPWFYLAHTPYSYLLIIISVLLLARELSRMQGIFRIQSILLLVAFLIPLIVNAYYILILPHIPLYNFTTAAFSVSGIIIALDLFKYEFLDLVPTARHSVMDQLDDGVIVLDSEGRIVDVNPAVLGIFNTDYDIIGSPVSTIAFREFRESIEELLSGRLNRTQVEFTHSQQRIYDLHISSMNRLSGEKSGSIITIRDITEREQLFREVHKLATIDNLTGLHNRRHLLEISADNLSKHEISSLILFDIDTFKYVNDTFGHDAGDIVLSFLAEACRDMMKSQYLFGRLGGDEFALLLPGEGLDDACSFAEVIRQRVSSLSVPTNSGNLSVTVSLGVASTYQLEQKQDLDELISLADQAMYQAKVSGKNQVGAAKPKDVLAH